MSTSNFNVNENAMQSASISAEAKIAQTQAVAQAQAQAHAYDASGQMRPTTADSWEGDVQVGNVNMSLSKRKLSSESTSRRRVR